MISSLRPRVTRQIAFAGFNAGALLMVVLFVLAPLVERFSDRADTITQGETDLARQQALRAQALSTMSGSSPQGDHFLPGQDYSTADADLQQILKSLATGSGVRLVGIRGLGASLGRPADRMVTARLDVEGSSSAIGALIQSIETHDPCLFIGGLTMRANVARAGTLADDLSAQLSVLGAFKRPTLARGDR